MPPFRRCAVSLILAAVVAAGAAAPAQAAGGNCPPRRCFPPTGARVDDSYDSISKRVVLKFTVVNAVRGTSARVSCAGGRAKGCPPQLRGRAKVITARRAGSFSLGPALSGARLAKGAVVTVILRNPGALYYRATYTITGPTSISIKGVCQQPSGPPIGCA